MLLYKLASVDISWWIRNTLTSRRRIDHGKISHTLYIDASTLGWGASLNDTTTGGWWSSSEESHNVNYLELKTILLGLQSLYKEVTNDRIRVMTYSTTAAAYARNMAGSRCLPCNDIARQIWEWCVPRNIWLSISHIPGEINAIADQASRVFDDSTEWKLNVDVFNRIVTSLTTPTIDMFASRFNYQLTPYVSWPPDPQAMAIDAFTLDWTNHFFYTLFPPLASYHSFFRNWKWIKPKPSLLPPIGQHSHGATPPAKTHEQRPSTIQPRTAKPPGGTAWPSDGLLLIRKSLQSRGISQATQDIILNSWRTATQRQYRVYLEKWQSSADRRAVDPLHPSVKDVLEFLQGLYERGLGYS